MCLEIKAWRTRKNFLVTTNSIKQKHLSTFQIIVLQSFQILKNFQSSNSKTLFPQKNPQNFFNPWSFNKERNVQIKLNINSKFILCFFAKKNTKKTSPYFISIVIWEFHFQEISFSLWFSSQIWKTAFYYQFGYFFFSEKFLFH